MIQIPGDCINTSNIDQNSAPNQFLCPISRQVMRNPVVATDGYSYEKQSLQKWFQNKVTSPVMGIKLQKKTIQNRALKAAIFYHNERDLKASQNAQKLVQNAYDYLSNTLPQLINDIGLVDTDKLVVMTIQNLQLRKSLQKIRAIFQKIEPRPLGIDNSYCNYCAKIRQGNQRIKQIIKQSQHILSTPPIVEQLNTDAIQFKYLPISCQTLKKIDFQYIKNEETLVMKKFKSYGLEKLPLQALIKRIKVANKIPPQHFVHIWRADLELSQFITLIKKQLVVQSCSYVRRIKEVGKKVTDLKLRLQDLKLKPQQYLIFEHGSIGPPKQQFVFRGEEVKCRYCYKLKSEKFKCACDGVSYCSQECGQKDKEYHKKQCKLLQVRPVAS